MSTPYIGEIRMFGFSRVPNGWFACDGSLQSIAAYETLFVLIGTTYGGDGVSTFAVPDLRGRVPVHQGQGPGLTNRVLGQIAGSETVTLTPNQMPTHNHTMLASTQAATSAVPTGQAALAAVSGETLYATPPGSGATLTMLTSAIGPAGGNQPHDNCMPTLTVQFCIACEGVFPSRN